MRRFVLAAIILLLAAGAWWFVEGRPGGGSPSAAPDAGDERDAGQPPVLVGRPEEGERPGDTEGGPDRGNEAEEQAALTPFVTGRILGPDGRPVEGAEAISLCVVSLYGNIDVYSNSAAEKDGRFRIRVLPRTAMTISATAPGFGMTLGPRLRLEADASQDVGNLILTPEETIRVRVVDEGGTGVEGATIYLENEADPLPEAWAALHQASDGWAADEATDAQGRLEFHKLPPGTYRLLLSYGEANSFDRVREHVPAGARVKFVIPTRSSPVSMHLRIRVLGPDGRPVERAIVELRGRDGAATGGPHRDGLHHVELESALGPVDLVVWHAQNEFGEPLGYAPAIVRDVSPQEEPLEVRLGEGRKIAGRVVGASEDALWTVKAEFLVAPDGSVAAPDSPHAEGYRLLRRSARSEEAGKFEVTGLPPGPIRLTAAGPGRMRDGPVCVEAGSTDVRLRMVSTRKLRLHIRPPDGLQFGHVSLRVGWWLEGGLQFRYSAQGGGGADPNVRVFEIPGLDPDGRFRVEANGTCSGVRCGESALDRVAPREKPYVLQLEEGKHVRGTVVREDGSPVWGAQVHYRPEAGGEFNPNVFVDHRYMGHVMTDASGSFDLGGLDDGEYLLTVRAPGLTDFGPPLRVRADSSGHRITVTPARTITGRVLDPGGGSADGLRAAAVPQRGGPPQLWSPHAVTADGFFAIEGLAPGRYRIAVWNRWDFEDRRCVRSEPVKAGTRDVRLEFAQGDRLEGTIRDGEGRIVPGAVIRLLGPWTHREARADRAGRYRIGGIPPGTYRVEVVSPRGAKAERTFVSAPDGPGSTLDVTL